MVLDGMKGFNRAGSINGGGDSSSNISRGEGDTEITEARPGDGDPGRQVGQGDGLFKRVEIESIPFKQVLQSLLTNNNCIVDKMLRFKIFPLWRGGRGT